MRLITNRVFVILACIVMQAGCSMMNERYQVPPNYAAAPVALPIKADANGWYKFSGFSFQGSLKDGVPDGPGQCRTSYVTDIGIDGDPWTSDVVDLCIFRDGERIDELHAIRMKQSAKLVEAGRNHKESERQEARDRAWRENEASVRAANQGMREAMLGFQQNLGAYAQQDARQVAQVNSAYANAIQQKQQRADEDSAEQRRQREIAAEEAKARARMAERMRAETNASRSTNDRSLTVQQTTPGQIIIKPPVNKECPPGWTWYNPATGQGAPGGTCYSNPDAANKSGATSQGSSPVEVGATKGSAGSNGLPGGAAGTPATVGEQVPTKVAKVGDKGGSDHSGQVTSQPVSVDEPSGKKRKHEYEYKTIAIGAEWKDCEGSREGAQNWGRRSLDNVGYDACAALDGGWSRDKITFTGYEQAIACKDGKSWKYKITDAIVSCRHMN